MAFDLVSLEHVAVSLAISAIATTVKNPNSAHAQQLRAQIEVLQEACAAFLAAVPAPTPKV